MKNECSIVQDILPLYVEEMVSDDTVSFVRSILRTARDVVQSWKNCKNRLRCS